MVGIRNSPYLWLNLHKRGIEMNLQTVKGFELFNMDRPDPYNETMQFKTLSVAKSAQRHYGGTIRQCLIHQEKKG